MRMNPATSARVLAVALCLLPLAGCDTGPYKSDFSVIVANRASNTIEVMANGGALGQVTTGQTSTFTLTLTESNANILSNGVAPTPRAEVTMSARDTRTGLVSPTRSLTLSQGSPALVEFSTADFPSPTPPPTVARFNLSPTNPGINQAVSFNASASTASNATYAWDFGDMTTGTGVTTTHPYPRPGNFTVTLTVTSDSGNASTASRVVNVSGNLPPVAANFTFSPTGPAINQNVLFSVQMFGPVVLDARYEWNFGDGTTGTGSTATHAYGRAGTYAVTLRVTNPGGQAAAATRTVTVTASLPAGSVDFTISPTDPHITEVVYVTATGSVANAVSYTWDFGDGAIGGGIRNSHVYTVARTYTITLTVRNELGQTGFASKTLEVLD